MKIDPSTLLAYRVLALSQQLYRGIEVVLEDELNLSVRQWRVLLMLANLGPQSMQAISEFWRYDKSQVSRAVSELLQRALVNTTACAQDRRRTIVTLTAQGHRIYERGLPLSLARQQRLTECLSPDALRTFENTLDILNRQAQALLREQLEKRAAGAQQGKAKTNANASSA